MPDTKNTRRDASSKSLKHHSCALCHRRKVKCDKKIPCSYCKIRGESCVPAPTPVPKPRKKRFPEAELLARLRRYETALKEYGADIDSINGTVNNADSRTSSSFKRDTDASPPTDLIPERPSTTKSRDNLNLSAAEDGVSR